MCIVVSAAFGPQGRSLITTKPMSTRSRGCARVLKLGTKNKSLIPLDSVALRHFVSLVVSLKNKGLSTKSAKPLI